MRRLTILSVLLLLAIPFVFEVPGTNAAPVQLTLSQSGVLAQDSLTTGNLAYWTLYGDAVQRQAPYAYNEDSSGLHIGIQAAKQGQWAGFYAESPNTNGQLFHAVLTLPYSSIPSGTFNTGLYVQTSTTHINYVTCTAEVYPGGYDWSVVYTTGNSRSAQKFYQVYYQAGGVGVPLTRDCTIITNGNNYLEVYLDGRLVYSSTTLKLQMPAPFNSYLEVESSYAGGMLTGTYSDYYATTSNLVQVQGAPAGYTAEIVDSQNTVLSTAKVGSGGTALLDVGQYHLPINGTVRVYDSSNNLFATTSGAGPIWGGDIYQGSSTSTSTTSGSTTTISTSSTSTTSTSTSTTTTTSSTTLQPQTLTVASVDQKGNPIYGYYVTLQDQNHKVLQAGYTTVTFKSVIAGVTYVVEADGYSTCSFNHWQDTGDANYQRTFVANASGESFTAVYACL